MSGALAESSLVEMGDTEKADLGGRLADLANRSSETRSILAPASPRTQGLFGIPEIPLPVIPPPVHPSLADPALLLNVVSASGAPVDMNPRPSRSTNTPRPEPGDSPSSANQRSPEVARPLNVTDALSYLDAVKNQFQDSPDVYNQFLDIMKDFKSQAIDTPGVIERVSRLFTGNPYLIQGFNTFLPVGYRIDISADPSDPNTIIVTTPSGTTTQTTNGVIVSTRPARDIPAPTPLAQPNPASYPITAPLLQNAATGPGSRSITPWHGQPAFEQATSFSPGPPNHQTTAAASFLNNLNNTNNKNTVERQPQGEFNHAIQYLNNIKARFAEEPNTYKQFLDILQAYQKEQKNPQDSQVYSQVQALFKDAPDLLAEFKKFLPNAIPASPGPNGMAPLPQTGSGHAGPPYPPDDSPPNNAAKKPPPSKRSRKRVPEKEATPVPPPKPVPSRQAKKVKHTHNQDIDAAPFPNYASGPRSPPFYGNGQTGSQNLAQPGQPHPSQVQDFSNHPYADQLLFFDRAKKALESREDYEDFLKLLSLFSKDVIDAQTLVEQARGYFGRSSELMADFEHLIHFDDRDKLDKGPPGSIRTGPPEAPSALPVDDGEGPSYRRLLPSETQLACSGRDELCRSVLNDEWVSHPTWASEESGFVSHKKTPFEEAVHKSEEERHEFHVQIEALTRTIAVLEPINSRIDGMTNEERTAFRLKPDFGGSGMSIYHRIIKKVYGRDWGVEVISALQDTPSVAVPVVLARLKVKDEEWRRAQREWSRTWKEVDSKNFYKSLDHQGTNFKQNDKKNITAKYFVADIQTIKKQQLKKTERRGSKSFAHAPVGHQLEYSFKNAAVLQDTLKLVFSFMEHSQAQYSPQERRAVEKFLRAFVPLMCMTSEAELKNSASGEATGEDDSGGNDHGDGSRSASGKRSAGGAHSTPFSGIPASDLRKKLLKTVQEKASRKDGVAASSVASRAASPSSAGHRSPQVAPMDIDSAESADIWIKEGCLKSAPDVIASVSDREHPFFVNTTFYTLLRLLELLYSRLLMCHEIGAQYASQKHAPLLANRVAVDLGLDDPNGPASVLAQTMDHLGKPAAEDTNVVYMYLLTACEKLFDSELDQATFEEHMRWFFGTKAYTLFTLDKSIIALVKQVQTILSDNKCQELWLSLKNAQSAKNNSVQDIIRYRREAERHAGQDDHLYRLQWVRESRCMRVSLCSPDEPSVQADGSALSRWWGYVSTYVMTLPTEWLPEPKKTTSPLFLRRNVRVAGESTAPVVEDHMKVRIGVPTYKLVYETGSEDMILHAWDKESSEMLARARAREEERRRVAHSSF